ncbi:MAG: site-2 protease family protein [Nitrosomonas sp.]|uniref:site-2 protease family protein n=1 Tax=Nitrosomonas sp. TaxID=42353 RepID=UPI002734BE61|nr:site-2 protease family protein [Nitrosomonas sp.]MDP1934197.1 site-2 protease family protein [Nitrosomonas sp.]MDP3280230.1 site-2 protease family protein [Nitrosomonas sp.]MDP3663867.1 site-2 protease family protein [Nitrosomonas sp.]MDZ4107070.1 site-2 protease family protein [Nitrosomonas sp.]
MDEIIQGIAIYALPVIFAITMHEAAHGYIAKHFGDFTAFNEGRISLNPIRHIDLIGTILVPLTLFVLSKMTVGAGFLFGWAKPVPVNFSNLRQPKRDMLWVAAAGPGANLLMAIFWALMIKIAIAMPESSFARPLALMGIAGIEINVILMVLNLLPLPPLDGGRMAISLLPHRIAYPFSRIEPYGFIILLGLLFSGVLGAVIGPVITWAKIIIVSIFGLYI